MKIIFNGDDFGLSPGCNAAIADCAKKGLLRSTSIMMNMPYAAQAADLAKDLPFLSVGIHFNLTVGTPMTKTYPLTKEDGTFSKDILHEEANLSREDIYAELLAQYQAFVQMFGRKPAHINSHHGLEQNRTARSVMQQMSRDYDIPMRGYIYDGTRQMEGISFITPTLFMPSIKGPVPAADVIAWLETQPADAIVEIAAHPGYVDPYMQQISSLTTGREADAALFMDESLKAWTAGKGAQVQDYTCIPRLEA